MVRRRVVPEVGEDGRAVATRGDAVGGAVVGEAGQHLIGQVWSALNSQEVFSSPSSAAGSDIFGPCVHSHCVVRPVTLRCWPVASGAVGAYRGTPRGGPASNCLTCCRAARMHRMRPSSAAGLPTCVPAFAY
eukprot:scaffold54344_cov87-Phaeocystis_antarctica.AAC.1